MDKRANARETARARAKATTARSISRQPKTGRSNLSARTRNPIQTKKGIKENCPEEVKESAPKGARAVHAAQRRELHEPS